MFFLLWNLLVGSIQAQNNFWQGFEYTWLRKVVGFETAHRFGAFDNHIEGKKAFVKVSPGVNGDFTFPSVYWRDMQGLQADNIVFSANVSITDNLEDNKAEIQANLTANIAHLFQSSDLPLAYPFLQGFQINMKCVETIGEKCNSNGIWPYILDIGWDKCDAALCHGFVRIGRTWTPWHGGGKALNKKMNYNVTIYGMIPRISQDDMSYHQKYIEETISYHGAPSIQNISDASVAGFHRIGLQFLETNGKELLGRYMETLQFKLNSEPKTNMTELTMQIKGPTATTPESNVKIWANIGVISSWTQGKDIFGTPNHKNTTICWDDFPHEGFFRCSKHGYPVQHSAEIDLSI